MMYPEFLISKAQSRRTETAIHNKLPLSSANPLCPTEINFLTNLFCIVLLTSTKNPVGYLRSVLCTSLRLPSRSPLRSATCTPIKKAGYGPDRVRRPLISKYTQYSYIPAK